MSRAPGLFACLIRTHHITSRKKVQRVRRAAGQLGVDFVLLRSGGAPGLMFAEGRDEDALGEWVAAVQALRYKDFRCVAKPAVVEGRDDTLKRTGFEETGEMKDFAGEMDSRRLGEWWRKGMGYGANGD